MGFFVPINACLLSAVRIQPVKAFQSLDTGFCHLSSFFNKVLREEVYMVLVFVKVMWSKHSREYRHA